MRVPKEGLFSGILTDEERSKLDREDYEKNGFLKIYSSEMGFEFWLVKHLELKATVELSGVPAIAEVELLALQEDDLSPLEKQWVLIERFKWGGQLIVESEEESNKIRNKRLLVKYKHKRPSKN